MAKSYKHRIELSKEERKKINRLIASDDLPQRLVKYLRILLDSDESSGRIPENVKEIAGKHGVSIKTTVAIKQEYLKNGLAWALGEWRSRNPVISIHLTDKERNRLKKAIHSHNTPPAIRDRAGILLDVDKSGGRVPESGIKIARKYGWYPTNVSKLKQQYTEKGLDAVVFSLYAKRIKYYVNLNKNDRQRLEQLLLSEDTPPNIRIKAHILLAYDKLTGQMPRGATYSKIWQQCAYKGNRIIYSTKKTYVQGGLDAVLALSRTRGNVKYCVVLTEAQKQKLKQVLSSNNAAPFVKRRAAILLDADESNGRTPSAVNDLAQKHNVDCTTIVKMKKRFFGSRFGLVLPIGVMISGSGRMMARITRAVAVRAMIPPAMRAMFLALLLLILLSRPG
jgi:hypothetical protein